MEQDLLTALFSQTGDAVLVVDDQRIIRLATPQVETLFGWRPDELSGQPLSVLLPESVRVRHDRLAAGYQQHPTPRAMGAGLELRGLHQDGSEFRVDIALGPIVFDGCTYVACVIRPLEDEQPAPVAVGAADESRVAALQSMFGVGLSLSASLDDFGTETSRARVERAAEDLRHAVEEIRAHLDQG